MSTVDFRLLSPEQFQKIQTDAAGIDNPDTLRLGIRLMADHATALQEQIDTLAEFLMEHTPVGKYGSIGAVEHAIAHIKALEGI